MKRIALLITFLTCCGILFSQEANTCVIKAPEKLERSGRNQQIHVQFKSSCPVLEVEITVLSRWGNVMYVSNQLDHLWEGKEKEPGTYFFTIKGSFTNGSKIDQNGFLTVL